MFRQILPLRTMPFVLGMIVAGTSMSPAANLGPNDTQPAANVPNNPNPPAMQQPPAPAPVMNVPNSNQTASDFPGPIVRDWVTASAMAARARAIYRQSDVDLTVAIRRAQMNFEHSQDYQNAQTAERQAYADYVAARDRALVSLRDNSKYRAIAELRDDLAAKLSRRRADKHADKDEILAMATLKMQYASDARAIEVQALDASPEVKSARDRMVAASRHVSELRSNLDTAIRDNPEIASVRRSLIESRISMLTADAYASAATIASDAALNYQYFLHRNDQGYYAPWGPAATGGGIGGGYYSPFWSH
jgi:hypothetical protein